MTQTHEGEAKRLFPRYLEEPPGMTLRDWLAGQALAGIVQRGEAISRKQAWAAYDIADAMLKEREANDPDTQRGADSTSGKGGGEGDPCAD